MPSAVADIELEVAEGERLPVLDIDRRGGIRVRCAPSLQALRAGDAERQVGIDADRLGVILNELRLWLAGLSGEESALMLVPCAGWRLEALRGGVGGGVGVGGGSVAAGLRKRLRIGERRNAARLDMQIERAVRSLFEDF